MARVNFESGPGYYRRNANADAAGVASHGAKHSMEAGLNKQEAISGLSGGCIFSNS
jgi:hypothetical protein